MISNVHFPEPKSELENERTRKWLTLCAVVDDRKQTGYSGIGYLYLFHTKVSSVSSLFTMNL